MSIRGIFIAVVCLCVFTGWEMKAQDRPKEAGLIEKIVIKGNKKIESDAIRSKLVSKEGKPYEAAKVRQDLQELFGTGFFYNVLIDKTESGPITLTYTVVEKPSVTEIDYRDNEEMNDDELKEITGLKPYEFLNLSKIRESIEKIEKAYEDKGFSSRESHMQLSRLTVKMAFVSFSIFSKTTK